MDEAPHLTLDWQWSRGWSPDWHCQSYNKSTHHAQSVRSFQHSRGVDQFHTSARVERWTAVLASAPSREARALAHFSPDQVFPVVTHNNYVREHEKPGIVLCIIIHDLRALTRFIFSNLGIGLSATLFPARSIKIAYPVLILPLMK